MKIMSFINLTFLLASCVKGAVKEHEPHEMMMMKARHKK